MILKKKICQCIFANSSLSEWVAPHLNKIEFRLPNDAMCQVWLILQQLFCRRFLYFVNVFLQLRYYLLFQKGMVILFNKPSYISFTNDTLCQVWLKLTLLYWRGGSLNFDIVFLLFHYYLPFEKGVALHLNKLEIPFTQGCFPYWPRWFWVDLKFRQCIFAISVIFSSGKNPLKQIWIVFTQGCSLLNLVEIGIVILKKIFKFRQCISAISLLYPLGNGCGPLFVQVFKVLYTCSWNVWPYVQSYSKLLKKESMSFPKER